MGLAASFLFLPRLFDKVEYSAGAVPLASVAAINLPPELPPPPKHLPKPEPLKGVYMSQCVVGTPSFRQQLVQLIEDTELNSIVIDIKDYTGAISFRTDNPVLASSVSTKCGAADMAGFVASLHEKGIYVIGRITVFQSPFHTASHPEWAIKTKSDPNKVWKDFKGLSFVDVGAKPYWDYIVELSKESYNIGFDELNYDYVRYPSDGPMSEVNATWSQGRTRAEVLKDFFAHLHGQLKPLGVITSADLFGLTTNAKDDLGIGQVLENALPYFDYIAPMVYPSHYGAGHLGFQKPAEHPYEVIKDAMDHATERAKLIDEPASKIRPWLQDFDLGAIYTPELIRQQMQATYDAGLTDWLLWDPSNKYTREALEPAKPATP
jgi:hypothetical protein